MFGQVIPIACGSSIMYIYNVIIKLNSLTEYFIAA